MRYKLVISNNMYWACKMGEVSYFMYMEVHIGD